MKKIMLNRIHHTSIICSDYDKSRAFYTGILGLEIIRETYRQERNSYKLDLALNGIYVIELFSFPSPPRRVSHPEAAGLRHIAFETDNLDSVIKTLKNQNIPAEPVLVDEATNKRFTFIFDPDNLPIELYEK
jgi:glyoxylase I family protein